MRKCDNYKELALKDNWASGIRRGIVRVIHESAFSPHERDKLLERLQIAQGEETLVYVDTFIALRSAVEERLLYIKWNLISIDQSMSLWDKPETILLKSEEVGICTTEAMAMRGDASGLGLEVQFGACMQAASAAAKRYMTIFSQGQNIRRHLGADGRH